MEKIKNSFMGIIVGIIFLIIGVVLLFFNESNNVKNIKSVGEAREELVKTDISPLDTSKDNKLVSVSGKLSYDNSELIDGELNVSSNKKTYKMKRYVEVYQWDEEEDNSGDTTTYTYEKVWKSSMINSNSFNDKSHKNPENKPYENMSFYANDIKLGDYNISEDNISSINTNEKVNLTGISLSYGLSIQGNYITNSVDINNPEIGDYRISYELVNTDDISIVAMQEGNSLVGYKTKQGKTIHLTSSGIKTGNELIDSLEKSNNTMKWILRVVGSLLIIFGIVGLLSPLNNILNLVPLVGKRISGVITLMAMSAGFGLSLIIIAIAWIVYRPLLGICLLLGSGAFIGLFVYLIKKNKNKQVENNTENNVINNMNANNNLDTVNLNNSFVNQNPTNNVVPTPIDNQVNQNNNNNG